MQVRQKMVVCLPMFLKVMDKIDSHPVDGSGQSSSGHGVWVATNLGLESGWFWSYATHRPQNVDPLLAE